MPSRISYRSCLPALLVLLTLGPVSLGCTASQLTTNGTNIVMLYDEPAGCENLGGVLGRGGGMS